MDLKGKMQEKIAAANVQRANAGASRPAVSQSAQAANGSKAAALYQNAHAAKLAARSNLQAAKAAGADKGVVKQLRQQKQAAKADAQATRQMARQSGATRADMVSARSANQQTVRDSGRDLRTNAKAAIGQARAAGAPKETIAQLKTARDIGKTRAQSAQAKLKSMAAGNMGKKPGMAKGGKVSKKKC